VSPAAADRQGRLVRLGGELGVVAGIAIDHRDSFRVMLEREGLTGLEDADLRELKLRLARVLAPAATAIMLDEEFGGSALDAGAIPPSVALIMPLEAQGYETVEDGRTTTLLADFSPEHALRRGADACKLLLPYRVDHEPSAGRQDALVATTAVACHAMGLPLVVEPVVYRWSTETPEGYASGYHRLVVAAVARLQPLGADLLKLPFPVLDLAASGAAKATEACRELGEAAAGTPWVLLGAGAALEVFVEQVRIAGMAGASGFLAGRGIWGAALTRDPDEAERIATTVCRPAFERCRAVAEGVARPLATIAAS
jgi:tagatose-1,6-bisphosphate aldolase